MLKETEDFINAIDPDFISYMKSIKKEYVLDEALNIFDNYMEIFINYLRSVTSGKVLTGEYTTILDCDVFYKDKSTPFCTFLYNQSTGVYLVIFGSIVISGDGEYRPFIVQIERNQISQFGRIYDMQLNDPKSILYDIEVEYTIFRKKHSRIIVDSRIAEVLVMYVVQKRKSIIHVRADNVLESYADVITSLAEKTEFNVGMGREVVALLFHSDKFMSTVKLVPITEEYKSQRPDISHTVWKELYFGHLVNSLFSNFVCNGFPILISWITVDGYVYKNPIVRDKIDASGELVDVRKMLQDIHIGEHTDVGKYIQKSIHFMDKNLIYSDKSIGMILPDAGFTYGNLPEVVHIEEFARLMEPEVFMSNIFNVIYSLYCLNSKLGVIHNDLHINNVCIDSVFYYASIFYRVEDIYYMMNPGRNISYIIDFSRSILSYEKIRMLPEDSHTMIQNTNNSITHTYKMLFPDFYKMNSAFIREAIRGYPDIVFKLYTGIDMYRFACGLKHILETMKYHQHIIDIIDTIRKMSQFALLDVLMNVGDTIQHASDIDYPNRMIFEEIYSEYIYGRDDIRPVHSVLILNYNNDLIYDYEHPGFYMAPSPELCEVAKKIFVSEGAKNLMCDYKEI